MCCGILGNTQRVCRFSKPGSCAQQRPEMPLRARKAKSGSEPLSGGTCHLHSTGRQKKRRLRRKRSVARRTLGNTSWYAFQKSGPKLAHQDIPNSASAWPAGAGSGGRRDGRKRRPSARLARADGEPHRSKWRGRRYTALRERNAMTRSSGELRRGSTAPGRCPRAAHRPRPGRCSRSTGPRGGSPGGASPPRNTSRSAPRCAARAPPRAHPRQACTGTAGACPCGRTAAGSVAFGSSLFPNRRQVYSEAVGRALAHGEWVAPTAAAPHLKNSGQLGPHSFGCGVPPIVLFTENPNLPCLASGCSGSAWRGVRAKEAQLPRQPRLNSRETGGAKNSEPRG